MDKVKLQKQLLKWLNKRGYTTSDVIVSHGGAMVLEGVRDDTRDIDLTVSPHVWVEETRRNRNSPIAIGGGVWLLNVADNIDIHIGGDCIFNTDKQVLNICDETDIQYYNMNKTYQQYMKLNRRKDKKTLKQLRETITA